MKMLHGLICVAALMLFSIPAVADIKHMYSSGSWGVFYGIAENNSSEALCIMSSQGNSGRSVNVKYSSISQTYFIHFKKDSWKIPDDTAIRMEIEIDSMGAWEIVGYGFGQLIEVEFDPTKEDVVRAFMREMALGNSMLIKYSGNEAPWKFSMKGTANTIPRFEECVAILKRNFPNGSDTTQPFESQPYTSENNSQPFDSQEFSTRPTTRSF